MQVRIRPINATLTRDTDTFTRMDPYVVISTNNERQKTEYCNEGGKQPYWNDTLVFNNAMAPNFNVQVWDRDNVTDDIVGEGMLQINPNGGSGNYNVQIFHNGRSAGQVNLFVEAGGFNQGQGFGGGFGGCQLGW